MQQSNAQTEAPQYLGYLPAELTAIYGLALMQCIDA
jgi:hypothetical protein